MLTLSLSLAGTASSLVAKECSERHASRAVRVREERAHRSGLRGGHLLRGGELLQQRDVVRKNGHGQCAVEVVRLVSDEPPSDCDSDRWRNAN